MTYEEKKLLEKRCKGTIGYSEAENKESFMTGADVALRLSEHYYEEKIKQLQRRLDGCESVSKIYAEDLTTLASIIKRYSNDD